MGSSAKASERQFLQSQLCSRKSSCPVEQSYLLAVCMHVVYTHLPTHPHIVCLKCLAFLSTWTSWKSVPPEVRHRSPAHCLSNANAQLFLAPLADSPLPLKSHLPCLLLPWVIVLVVAAVNHLCTVTSARHTRAALWGFVSTGCRPGLAGPSFCNSLAQ